MTIGITWYSPLWWGYSSLWLFHCSHGSGTGAKHFQIIVLGLELSVRWLLNKEG